MEKIYDKTGLSSKLPILKWGFSTLGFILLLLIVLVIGLLMIFSPSGNMIMPNTDLSAFAWLMSSIW